MFRCRTPPIWRPCLLLSLGDRAPDKLTGVVNVSAIDYPSTQARIRVPIVIGEQWRLVWGALRVLDSAKLLPCCGDRLHKTWVEGQYVPFRREDPLRVIGMQGIGLVEKEVQILESA